MENLSSRQLRYNRVNVRLMFFLYCICIVSLLLLTDLGLIPEISAFLHGGFGRDKVAHFVLVGLFAWLFNSVFSLGYINLARLRIFVGTVVIVAVLTLEELTQLWIPTRHFELLDLLAGYLGMGTAEIVLRHNRNVLVRFEKPSDQVKH